MSEYYAVQRSSKYLAHYGVKGMKWGVRRAMHLADGQARNEKALRKLSDHYQKALLKNAKLKERTNRNAQKEEAKSSAAGGAMLLGVAGLGGLAAKKSKSTTLAGYSAIAGAGGLAALGSSAASAYRATKRGNKRAVVKYNKFNNEMKKTFTKPMRRKINKFIKANPEYDWFEGQRYRRG